MDGVMLMAIRLSARNVDRRAVLFSRSCHKRGERIGRSGCEAVRRF